MDKITVSISEEQNKKLDKISNTEYENKSEAVRGLLEKGMKYDEDVKKKDKKIKRLENEKQKILEQREEHQELVKFAKEQKSAIEKREQIKDGGIITRTKYLLFGKNNQK